MDADGGLSREARWALVLPHRDYLVTVARRRGLSAHDADDCVHDALVRCVEFADLDPEQVLPFLVTVTKRLAVDRHRRALRDLRLSGRLGSWYVDEPSPEESVCDREEASWVARRLDSLPPRQQAVLEDRAHGLSTGQVAERQSLSYKTVESLLSRARASARAVLASSLAALGVLRRQPHATRPAASLALVTVAALATVSLVLSRPHPSMPSGRSPVYVLPVTSSASGTPAAATTAALAGLPQPVSADPPSGSPTPGASRTPSPGLTDLGVEQSFGPVTVQVSVFPSDDDTYSPTERVEHCVRYGVDLDRGVRCRYPPSASPSRSPGPGP